jgi:hypothetical protein
MKWDGWLYFGAMVLLGLSWLFVCKFVEVLNRWIG